MLQRRQFFALLAGAAAVLAVNPAKGSASSRRTLLVIELAGGNDGLNTFIPYRDPLYLKLRPTLGIKDGIPVSDRVALHPKLVDWKPLLEKGRMAVVQNVSYPQPDLSHFRSKEIWQSASTAPNPESGWLGRYLGAVSAASTEDAIFVGDEYPLALESSPSSHFLHISPNLTIPAKGKLGQAIQALYNTPQSDPLAETVRRTVVASRDAIQKLAQDLKQKVNAHQYPDNLLGQQFALMSRLVDTQAKILYLTLGGWDTHTNQVKRQGQLLEILGSGLAALDRDLVSRGLGQQVTVMVQSEFGRRPAENGSGGTDHGTAGPMLLLGSVRTNFYGGDPALDSLVSNNLPMQVDFRSVYGEVLRWLGADPSSTIQGTYPALGIMS